MSNSLSTRPLSGAELSSGRGAGRAISPAGTLGSHQIYRAFTQHLVGVHRHVLFTIRSNSQPLIMGTEDFAIVLTDRNAGGGIVKKTLAALAAVGLIAAATVA